MNADDILFNLELQGPKRVHLIGIGGIAMAYLARWFLANKWQVSGSDLVRSPISAALIEEGAKFRLGHSRANIPKGIALVVRSQAVPLDNPEAREAFRRKLPLITLPEAVGALTRRYDTLAVAGAHGKSTTTALLALVMMGSKKDPTVCVGTKLRELRGSNFRKGKSKWLVLEADEYGRAFLNYSPLHLVITNIDREHLDTYKNISDIKRTFLKLISQVRPGGSVALNKDNAALRSLKAGAEKIAKDHNLDVRWYSLKDPAAPKIRRSLRIPGEHNLSNALGAYTLARNGLGLPAAAILRALGSYKGSWRRFEYKGEFAATDEGRRTRYDIFDDYAHHPTEIRATLQAFRDKFPRSALICVFQPHQAERLKRLFPEFRRSFGPADAVVLFPEYKVAGRDKVHAKFSSKSLAEALGKRHPGKPIVYLSEPRRFSRRFMISLAKNLKLETRSYVVVMMGAGTIADYTKKLVQ